MADESKGLRLSGIGFLQVLGLMFIALKSTVHPEWPWPIVLAPIYVPIVAGVLASVLIALIEVFEQQSEEKRKAGR